MPGTRTALAGISGGMLLATGLAVGVATGQDAPFGTEADVGYAGQLWDVMAERQLAGDDVIHAFPYAGTEPHGFQLETFFTEATVDGHSGALVVKRNYGPEGVEAAEVLANPDEHLASVTVMFRREQGYDPDNADWFWAKYLPDGSMDRNEAGMPLAGRVAKGADQGCIACHSTAGGGDYLFTTDSLP